VTPSANFLARAVLTGAVLALGGCISLLPNAKPVQLYRFDAPAAAAAAPAAAPAVSVVKDGVSFPSGVGGDRILTVSGDEAAFIADARWVEPASLMFNEAVTAAFDAPGSPRLTAPGAASGALVTLKLEVRRFQADYDKGSGAAPTVEVQVHALLIRNADRSYLAESQINVTEPADDNRVGAIVRAFNVAVGKATGQIRDWTAMQAPAVRP
jgi:cholesterol transport system auxiliary component